LSVRWRMPFNFYSENKKVSVPKYSSTLHFWHTKNSITSFVYHRGIMILSNSSKSKGNSMQE
jgi:hypothetical protein